LTIASSFGVLPEEAAYIGDSEVDIKTGHAAGMKTVSVSWGFRSREILKENGAEHIIDRPKELIHMIGKGI
jgi:phosphoglycolate phosphatase